MVHKVGALNSTEPSTRTYGSGPNRSAPMASKAERTVSCNIDLVCAAQSGQAQIPTFTSHRDLVYGSLIGVSRAQSRYSHDSEQFASRLV
jgi:hypothetical protein